MIILGMTTQFKPQANHTWSFGDKSKPSDMYVIRFCFIEAYFLKRNGGAFARYVHRFINDDFGFHPLVRRAAKKAQSSARAYERQRTKREIENLKKMNDEHIQKRFEAEAALTESEKTIYGLKLAIRELQK